MVEALNRMAGEHGVGRVDLVENRYVGIKSRGVYETPGVTVLHRAHQAIESITLDREQLRLRDSLMPKFAELVYNGYWFSPEMELLLGFMNQIQHGVTGTARLQLYKGNVTIVGRRAANSLYNPQYATFDEDDVYCQADAEGFIKINALRLKLHHIRKSKVLLQSEPAVDLAPLREGFIE
jgi:argininosuccinate synthase